MQRVFIVGCPRSGTTLFQSLIAAHPAVNSFPETKLFQYAYWENFSSKFQQRVYQFFGAELHRPDVLRSLNTRLSMSDKINWFIETLDKLTLEQEKYIWVEKTPEHIFFLPEIERYLPDAKFIHVLRNGLDTIASMYAATRMEKSELWGGQWSLNYCINRWKDSTKISRIYAGHPQHLVVEYDELLNNKIAVMTKCFNFIGIDYSENVLTDYKSEAVKLALNLPWHNGIEREIEAPSTPKYEKVFQEHIVNYILRELQT